MSNRRSFARLACLTLAVTAFALSAHAESKTSNEPRQMHKIKLESRRAELRIDVAAEQRVPAKRSPTKAPLNATPRQTELACTDPFDPNESCATATLVTPGAYGSRFVQGPSGAGDDDWYKVHVPRSMKLTVDLAFTHANGDIDMDLYGVCAGPMLTFSAGTTNSEHMEYVNDDPDQDYFFTVYDLDATCNGYSMTVGVVPTANLAPFTPAGWSGPLVARNDGTATCSAATISATLDGNAATTYISDAFIQTGPASTPGYVTYILLDDAVVGGPTFWGDPSSPGTVCDADYPDHLVVRGGRHTVTASLDPANQVVETSETDNDVFQQWVWSPLPIAYETPLARAVPPAVGTGSIANMDGFSYTRAPGFSWLTSIAATTPGDDYDLEVYDDYASSTSGFSNLIGVSNNVSNLTDFVVGQYIGAAATVYPGAVRYSIAGGGNGFLADASDSRSRTGGQQNPNVDWLGQTMQANRLANVYDHVMAPNATIHVTLRRTAGNSDLQFRVFAGTPGGVYSALEGTPSTAVTAQVDTAFYTDTSGQPGWHPIVVYRTNGTGANQPLSYELHINGTHLVSVETAPSASEFSFLGARPNPVDRGAQFEFALPANGHAKLALFDLSGRKVRTLLDGDVGVGKKSVAWDRRGDNGALVRPGIYLARLDAAGRVTTRRVSVVD